MSATIQYIDDKGVEKTIKVDDIMWLEPPQEYLERKEIKCKKVIGCMIKL